MFCYMESGKLPNAERVLESAVEAGIADDPTFVMAEVYKDAGDICVKLERYEKAIDLYEGCIRRDPTDKVTLSNMASCYAKLGHLESAKMAYQTALSIDPNYTEAARNLRVIDNAIAKLGEEKMADATS